MSDFVEKGILIADLEDGTAVDACFLLTSKSKSDTRQGKPYLRLKFQDRSGSIEARLWDNAEHFDEIAEASKVHHIVARVSSYNEELQLTVSRLDPLSADEVDMMEFLPRTAFDVDEMEEELRGFVSEMSNPYLKQLLKNFLDDEEFVARFRMAPAAKAMHHVFLGGLLEHTLSLFRLAVESMKLYPHVNQDIVLAGLFMHDMGKIYELSWDGMFDYTDKGRLVGHITMGVRMLEENAATIEGFPPDLLMHLTHIILAHHGQLEFGSPKLPQTIEAMIVHYLDDLDAKIQSITTHLADNRAEDSHWSSFHRLYERYFYKGDLSADHEAPPPPLPTPQAKQSSKKSSMDQTKQAPQTNTTNKDKPSEHELSLFNKVLTDA